MGNDPVGERGLRGRARGEGLHGGVGSGLSRPGRGGEQGRALGLLLPRTPAGPGLGWGAGSAPLLRSPLGKGDTESRFCSPAAFTVGFGASPALPAAASGCARTPLKMRVVRKYAFCSLLRKKKKSPVVQNDLGCEQSVSLVLTTRGAVPS